MKGTTAVAVLDLSPLPFSEAWFFFYVPFQLIRKDGGVIAKGLTSPPNDAIT